MFADDSLGTEKPTKIIAEIGLSHEGSLGLAISMAKGAIDQGADIIKFQAHFPEFESSKVESFRVPFAVQDSSRWNYWKRTSFSQEEWRILKGVIEDLGGVFSVSVFSANAVEMFLDLDIKVIKLGSGDLCNEELLDALKDYQGTVILSTGMANWSEIEKASDWLKSSQLNSDSAILQCTSMYPTPLKDVGLNVMQEIRSRLRTSSGLSDHSQGLSASIAAIVLGASYVEKHITLSPYMFGPDVFSSISLEQLRFLCEFRDDQTPLRTHVDKNRKAIEFEALRSTFGRSLGLVREMPSGSIIAIDDFCLRKPGGGFDWSQRFGLVGRKLVKPYLINELLEASHFITESRENES
jgi:N-acetylneuraminate synthase